MFIDFMVSLIWIIIGCKPQIPFFVLPNQNDQATLKVKIYLYNIQRIV